MRKRTRQKIDDVAIRCLDPARTRLARGLLAYLNRANRIAVPLDGG